MRLNNNNSMNIMLSGRNVRQFWHKSSSRNAGNRHRRIIDVSERIIIATTGKQCSWLNHHPFSSTTTSYNDNIEERTNATATPNQNISTSSSPTTSTNNDKLQISHLAELSKARLSALVVSTTAFGFLSAGPTALAFTSLPTFTAASIGTALCASSAATFNQVIEIDRDRQMKRTCNRPLVTGVVTKEMAIGLGCITGTSGGLILGLGTDPITTMLGLGNIGLYAGLYTYLKPRSELNTWVGAVVGAIPPVMGWTAAGGSPLDAEAILLGSTLFLWQFPHFFALNWMYRTDYKRGGFAMVAVNDPNGDRTASLIKRYGVYLASLPFISTALEVTSPMFAIDAGILLNGYALYVASKFDKERSNANARKVFLTSLWYLPCVMMLFLLHSRRWHEKDKLEDKENDVLQTMQKIMNRVQAKGRQLCIHEKIASNDVSIESEANKTRIDGAKCPITLGKAAASRSSEEEIELKQKRRESQPTSTN